MKLSLRSILVASSLVLALVLAGAGCDIELPPEEWDEFVEETVEEPEETECEGEPFPCYLDMGMCCSNGDSRPAKCIDGRWQCNSIYYCDPGHPGLILPGDPDFERICCNYSTFDGSELCESVDDPEELEKSEEPEDPSEPA